MKSLKARELMWMTLPVALLGGVAWWLSSGGKMSLSTLGMNQVIANARRPSLSLEKVQGRWNSPTSRAFIGSEKGCVVTAFVTASASLGQIRPGTVPTFRYFDIVDEKGHSLKAILSKPRKFSNTTNYNGVMTNTSWPTSTGQGVPDATYEVTANVPFVHMPRYTQRAVFKGVVGWGTARPIPVQFEVLPCWMSHQATCLHLQSVVWQPSSTGIGGQIEVVCRLANPRKPYVFGISEGGTVNSDSIGTGFDPQEWKAATRSDADDALLAEWSQRIESGDGHFNSLDLLRDHMEKAEDSLSSPQRMTGHSYSSLLPGFAPLCLGPKVQINGGQVRLLYSVNRIPSTYKAPIFRCEIYLVGDGFIAVRCPLRAKAAK